MTWRVLMAVVAALFGMAGRASMAQAPRSEGAPFVRLVEDEPASRGRSGAGQVVTRRVSLLNESNVSVTARVVSSSCPCTSATLEAATIEPGARVGLILRTTTSAVGTPQAYRVEVDVRPREAASDVAPQRIAVWIGYSPEALIVVRPNLILGAAVVNESVIFEALVRPADDAPVSIERVECGVDWLKVKGIGRSEVEGASALTLEGKLESEGVFVGTVRVYCAGDPEPVPLTVVLRSMWKVQTTPAGVVFSESRRGWGSKRVVVECRSRDGADMPVTNLRFTPDHGAACIQVEAIDTSRFLVTIEPERIDGSGHGSLAVEIVDVVAGQVVGRVPIVWISANAGRQVN